MQNYLAPKSVNSLPETIKESLWSFIRGDLDEDNFEKWLYINSELLYALDKIFYVNLVSISYSDKSEVNALKKMLFEVLAHQPNSCLCDAIPNSTCLYPFLEEERNIWDNYLNLTQIYASIENFSGVPPIHKSRWYQPVEIGCCNKCNTWWFRTFEESEFCGYYLIRLKPQEAALMIKSSDWPNDLWRQDLRNWENFINIKFSYWGRLYYKKESAVDQVNLLTNFTI